MSVHAYTYNEFFKLCNRLMIKVWRFCDGRQNISVLVVDDNKEFRELLGEFISDIENISLVGTAADGVDALKLINDLTPDVVLLDIIMPQIDGLGVLERVNTLKIQKKPKFIMLSALGKDKVTQKALSLGASYYVVKPFDLNVLVNRIRDLAHETISYSSSIMSSSIAISEAATGTYGAAAVIPKRAASISTSTQDGVTKYSKKEIELAVTKAMHDVGVPAHIKGYHYLRDAIVLSIEDIDIINYITKSYTLALLRPMAQRPAE